MATAADRGWPVGAFGKADLYLVSHPSPNAAQAAAGVLTVPGFPLWVHREVGPMFRGLVRDLQVMRRRHRLPELTSGGGNNFRPVRGYEQQWAWTRDPRYLSNHAWALAVDLSVASNPMGSPIRSDFPREETYQVAARYGIAWGREWSRPDPQHFEWTKTRTEAATWRATVEDGDDMFTTEDRDLLARVARELTQELPNRVDGKTSETLFGHVLNSDRAAFLALQEISAARRELAAVRTAVNALPANVRDLILDTVVTVDTWRDGDVVAEPTKLRYVLGRASEASVVRHRQEVSLGIEGDTEDTGATPAH